MTYAPKYAMQAGGSIRRFSNPERTFHFGLLKLSLDCRADNRPGILIFANSNYGMASAMAVRSLRKELPKMLEHRDENTIAFFHMETDEAECRRVLAGLTVSPIFNDNR